MDLSIIYGGSRADSRVLAYSYNQDTFGLFGIYISCRGEDQFHATRIFSVEIENDVLCHAINEAELTSIHNGQVTIEEEVLANIVGVSDDVMIYSNVSKDLSSPLSYNEEICIISDFSHMEHGDLNSVLSLDRVYGFIQQPEVRW